MFNNYCIRNKIFAYCLYKLSGPGPDRVWDGLWQYGNAWTGDQAVPCFWENPRPGPGLWGLVRSRPGPNRSGTELPQHYAIRDVGLALPVDEGGIGQLGGTTHGGPCRDQSNCLDWMCFAGFFTVLLCEDGAATAPSKFCTMACAHNPVSHGRAADGDAYVP